MVLLQTPWTRLSNGSAHGKICRAHLSTAEQATSVPRSLYSIAGLWQPCRMPALKKPVLLHDLPDTAEFTLADGACLTATVRISTRARRAKLSLTPRGDLVLTVPLAMNPTQFRASLPLFLPWLERARKTLLRTAPRPELPQHIALPLTGESFSIAPCGDMATGRKAAARQNSKAAIAQVASGARRVLLVEDREALRLYGAVEDISLCAQALRLWCRKKAALLLPPYLQNLAASQGFALAGASVRNQRGRWGSCSRANQKCGAQPPDLPWGFERARTLEQYTTRIRNFFSAPRLAALDTPPCMPQKGHFASPTNPEGRISLNWRALLLPTPLLEHLCWHELCHLRHMNHSAAYRAELARFSPQWPEHEKALNAAWRGLAWWALPGDDAPPSSR